MKEDIELLEFICKNAEMGKDSLTHILDDVKEMELREELQKHVRDYQEIYNESEGLLKKHGAQPEKAGFVSKTMAHVMSDFKLMRENTSSKISEMVIQGNTMGVTKMTQHLKNYHGEDKEIEAVAKKHIANLERNIDSLKAYL